MESTSSEPETIDVMELMKDLEEDEDFVDSTQPSSTVSLSTQATTPMKPPSYSFTLEPAGANDMSQWLTCFQMHGVLGRPAEGSSRDGRTYGKPRSKFYGSMTGSTPHTSDLLGAKLMVSSQETLAEHLQRSVSFETPPRKEMKKIFGQKDALDAYHSKGLTLGFDKDASSVSTSRLPWEGESVSSPSTPTFAAGSVNLQKWFQDDARKSKQRQGSRAAFKVLSGHETKSKLPPATEVFPPFVPKVPGSTSKGTEGPSYSMHSYAESSANVSAKRSHESHYARTHQMAAMSLNQTKEEPQQGRTGWFRHSFTVGNRRKGLSDVKSSTGNNRSSSLELEKVAAGLKVRIVLYSMTLSTNEHGVEESNAARAILTSIVGATFEERSVSEYPEYEQELKSALNTQVAIIPTVCARGRYITGLDNMMQLYKKGLLRSLLAESLAQDLKPNMPCICRGGKFLVCPVCKGRRKLARKDEDDDVLCRHCSATGLIKCPNCLHA